jgi:hypothetical protein
MRRRRRHEPPVEHLAVRGVVGPRERDALGARDRERLRDDAVHHGAPVGIRRELAVGEPAQRAERVQRGAVEHLLPERRDDALRRGRRNAGTVEGGGPRSRRRGEPRVARVGRADQHRIGEHRHARVSRPNDLGAEDHAPAEDALRADRARRGLEVAEPVLQRQEQPVGREPRRDLRRHRGRVEGLHRHEDHAEGTRERARVGDAPESADAVLAEQAVDHEAVARDRVEVRRAPEERHRMSRPRQQAAQDRAQRAGARDQYRFLGHGAARYVPLTAATSDVDPAGHRR